MIDPGLTFGEAAGQYDRARPDWPLDLLEALPLPVESTVLDLGAGTGKLTRLLAKRYARVIAVEPDSRMRELIEAAEVLPGSAEDIPVADAAVDGVFVGEAFHWFDGERAINEIARVLRQRGVLALLWNRFDPDDFVLPEGVLPPSTTPKHRLFSTGEWRRPFTGAPFEPLREVLVPQEREVSRAELLEYFASVSPVTALPPLERQHALERVADALDRPTYMQRWTATLHWTRLKDGAGEPVRTLLGQVNIEDFSAELRQDRST